MNKQEIIDIIKNYKKYANSNFEFADDHVIYKIGENKYLIDINDSWRKIVFSFPVWKFNMNSIKVSIAKSDRNTPKKILAKFRQVVRNINTLDFFLRQSRDVINKIEPAIKKLIKEEYYIDVNFDDKINFLKINFPKTTYYTKRRGRVRGTTTSFDPSKEKPRLVPNYEIYASLKENNQITLYFKFNCETNCLTLIKKEERYSISPKDITRIIRNEKLKKLMLANEETN